jgi:hypothetical protein
MKKLLAVSMLSVAALLAGCGHPQPYYAPPPPGVQIHDQGIHDGFEAARRDVAEGRPPYFQRHPRFRNPPVPGPAREDYRDGFRQGYEQFMHQGPQRPLPPPPPRAY